MQKKNLIAIFGGSFDPVHLGHIEIAQTLLHEFPIKEIRFIPCKQNVIKSKSPIANANHRLNMLKIAIAKNKNFVVDDREIKRKTPSYMVDTLESLRKEKADEHFALILGIDAFSQLEIWFEWKKLFTLTHVIIINRPDFILPTNGLLADFINRQTTKDFSDLLQNPYSKIYFYNDISIAISATKIREMIKNNKSFEQFVAKEVADYIKLHGLYKV